jgi:hypothetical protein
VSYDSLEISAYGGRPVELYKFTMGTSIWRHTDSDRNVVIGSETYETRYPISRSEPEMSEETTRSALKIETTADHPAARLFETGAPHQALWVSVFRAHVGDGETTLLWQGKVVGVIWNPDGGATIECDPVEKVFGKGGLRHVPGPYCQKRLYSSRCGVSEAAFTTTFTLDSVSSTGFVVSASEFATKPDQYFRMGEIYFPGLSARVLVVNHVGENLTLKTPILGLEAGAEGRAVAGCNHIWRS